MTQPLNILIAGVPYGRNNVGDEAIIATVVALVRESLPLAQITVSTDQPQETAEKLGVRTVELFGFDPPGYSRRNLKKEMQRCDIFIWGGATGLSDYPKIPLKLIKLAKRFNKKVALFSVGMNRELNPAHYQLRPGRKTKVLHTLEKLIPGNTNLVKAYESHLTNTAKRHIKKSLNQANLIITRDTKTKELLFDLGVDEQIHATADPALLLTPCSNERLREIWYEQCLWTDDQPIIGIGISSQREVTHPEKIAQLADDLITQQQCHVLFIPMNHRTDYETMASIKRLMTQHKDAKLLHGFFEPEEIQAISSKMALVISSRLHLLILASTAYVPIIGLSRGSKIDHFLELFDEKSCGSVETVDVAMLKSTCLRLLTDGAEYRKKAQLIVTQMQNEVRYNGILLKRLAGNQKPQKIIYICRRFNRELWGGTETVIINNAHELEKQGYQIKVFTTLALSTRKREIIDNIPIYRFPFCLPWLGLSPENKEALLKKGGNLLSFSLIWALIKEKNVSLIHTHVPKRIGASGRFAARLKNIPYLITLHGGWFNVPQSQYDQMTKPFEGKFEWGRLFGAILGSARLMEDAAAILCVGEDEYKDAYSKFPDKKIKYLPNGVNIHHFDHGSGDDFRHRYHLAATDFVLLCVSRIDFQKNQLFLVQAMAELAKTNPEIKLVLIGSISVETYYLTILDTIAHYHLEKQIIIIPGLDPDDPALLDAFKASDAFVFATLHEPFGIVILEAWAAKKPVLTAPTGGISGFTNDNENCLHFNPDSIPEFVSKVKNLQSNAVLAQKLAHNGYQKAARFYDWSVIVKVLAETYREVLHE